MQRCPTTSRTDRCPSRCRASRPASPRRGSARRDRLRRSGRPTRDAGTAGSWVRCRRGSRALRRASTARAPARETTHCDGPRARRACRRAGSVQPDRQRAARGDRSCLRMPARSLEAWCRWVRDEDAPAPDRSHGESAATAWRSRQSTGCRALPTARVLPSGRSRPAAPPDRARRHCRLRRACRAPGRSATTPACMSCRRRPAYGPRCGPRCSGRRYRPAPRASQRRAPCLRRPIGRPLRPRSACSILHVRNSDTHIGREDRLCAILEYPYCPIKRFNLSDRVIKIHANNEWPDDFPRLIRCARSKPRRGSAVSRSPPTSCV
ncbi:hypothetical protein BLAT2472_20021 [Burkholderia latens]